MTARPTSRSLCREVCGSRSDVDPEHLRLVRTAALQCYRRIRFRLPLEDLEQEAWFGLELALRTYRPDGGASLATWIKRKIWYRLHDFLRGQDHLSRQRRQQVKSGEAEDIRVRSLDERDSSGRSLASGLAARDGGIEEVERHDLVQRLLKRLRPLERQVVEAYYLHGLTMAAVGRRLGFSKNYVSIVHKGAIERLRMYDTCLRCGERFADARGCCSKCYSHYSSQVKRGLTSWAALEVDGKVWPPGQSGRSWRDQRNRNQVAQVAQQQQEEPAVDKDERLALLKDRHQRMREGNGGQGAQAQVNGAEPQVPNRLELPRRLLRQRSRPQRLGSGHRRRRPARLPLSLGLRALGDILAGLLAKLVRVAAPEAAHRAVAGAILPRQGPRARGRVGRAAPRRRGGRAGRRGPGQAEPQGAAGVRGARQRLGGPARLGADAGSVGVRPGGLREAGMRGRDEVQRAHVDALCWVLEHDHNQSFADNLKLAEDDILVALILGEANVPLSEEDRKVLTCNQAAAAGYELALSRKLGESLWIGDAKVQVVQVRGNKVRLAISAPKDVPIVRDEVRGNCDRPKEEQC